MKLSRLLLLVPAAGLLMTGCDSEATVKSISVSGSYLTEYVVGETFSSAGVVVTAEYSDGSKKDVSKEASFSGFSSEAAGSGSVTVSFGGQSTSYDIKVVNGYRFSDIEAEYKEYGVEVFIPVYEFAEATVELDEDYGYYLVKGSTAEEMAAYAAKMEAAGWALKEDSFGDLEGFYKDTRALAYLGDYTAYPEEEPLGGIMVQFDLNVFPAESFEELYALCGVEVSVPEYVSAAEDLYFEIDDSYFEAYGALIVWIDGSTTAELAAYAEALVAAGWEESVEDDDVYYEAAEGYALCTFWDYSEDEGDVGVVFFFPVVEEE